MRPSSLHPLRACAPHPIRGARSISSGTLSGVPWFNAGRSSFRYSPSSTSTLVALGTASGRPSRLRGVSASALRVQAGVSSYVYLFDAGEATQTALQAVSSSPSVTCGGCLSPTSTGTTFTGCRG